MRILAIRFQDLNSLRGTHELNLESGPLAEAGLFAITGPTGAGKSTILDAVTLALYSRAARYGTGRQDTADDMMSRGTLECAAAVDFVCESGRYSELGALAYQISSESAQKIKDGSIRVDAVALLKP